MIELLVSLSILIGGYFLVGYWSRKAKKDIDSYPSATVKRLDEFEEKIS